MAANKRFETLGDLVRVRANLLADCPACTNRSIMPAADLQRYFMLKRWHVHLSSVGGRLRCSRCGHKGARVRIQFGAPDGPWKPPFDEAGWKRLARRLRD